MVLLTSGGLFDSRMWLLCAAAVHLVSDVASARAVQVAIFFITLLPKTTVSLLVQAKAGRDIRAAARAIRVADIRVERRLRPVAAGHPVARLIEQIGRASCRERVCQDVSISVVAVSVTKKNTQRSHNNT